jgi:5-oxoprolinase (ATP-hydrolysing) subunit A
VNIDFNADMGESFGMYVMGNDEGFMRYISSANVACGFHAGDPTVMKKTVAIAKQYDVQVGAHPGFRDLQGFGRREIQMTMEEIHDDLIYQIGALKAFVEIAGLRLHHVKPHGVLYGLSIRREDIAKTICDAVKEIDSNMYLYTMNKGYVTEIAGTMGLRVVYELYADLDYDREGNLVISRHHDVREPKEVAKKAIRMVKEGKVTTTEGTEIDIQGSSVCLHSDTPNAYEIVKAIREALGEAGYTVAAPPL